MVSEVFLLVTLYCLMSGLLVAGCVRSNENEEKENEHAL